MERQRIISALRGFRGLDELDDDELHDLAGKVTIARWEPGDFVLREGEHGDSMLLLLSGKVASHVHRSDGHGRRELPMGPGAVFGEVGMLSGERRPADVVAVERSTTFEMRRADVEPLLWGNPGLAKLVTRLVRRRLRRSGELHRVGKYRLVGRIGRGSSSEVFQGVHETLARTVAVKMLNHVLVYDREFRDRFLLEARTVAELDHPNIVTVYDVESAFATWFIVMERVRGSDLRSLLQERGAMAPDEVAGLVQQAASALEYAHRCGVVHRDIKPANASVDESGRLKLLDFGLAARWDAATGRSRSVVGTPRYIAPEMARGHPSSPASDIYALGVMTFEMLTGRPPYDGDANEVLRKHVREPAPRLEEHLAEGVPEGLARFVRLALSKDPASRPVAGKALAALLGGPLDARNGSNPPGGSRSSQSPRATRLRSLAIDYPPAAAARVERLIERLAFDIEDIDGASLLTAELRPTGTAPVPTSSLSEVPPTRLMHLEEE